MSERVLIAMSGGVDSSVAAARLQRLGFDVVGVTLHLWDYPDDGSPQGRCCAPEDVHDARRVADLLGIPHYTFDRRALFRREVVDPFVDAYLAGVTPSPCVRCNRGVKMVELLHLADCLGARLVATGHYARIERADGKPRLYRGRDAQKDQSYFLHMLSARTLGRLCFPLGEASKADVRAEAQALGLPGANKGESQELCFVPTGRYDEFVKARADGRVRPGNIVDETGRVVGVHEGIHRFTVGQRRNLGVALGRRAYVTGVDPETHTVKVGPASALPCSEAVLVEVVVADDVRLPLSCEVAVRYRGTPEPAEVVHSDPKGARVRFKRPVRAVVSGQYAVFYQADRVLGGGLIQQGSAESQHQAGHELVRQEAYSGGVPA